MYAVEFETNAKNGIIKIPSKYKRLYSKHLRLIVMLPEEPSSLQNIENKSFILNTIKNPIEIPDFKPLSRDEVHEN